MVMGMHGGFEVASRETLKFTSNMTTQRKAHADSDSARFGSE